MNEENFFRMGVLRVGWPRGNTHTSKEKKNKCCYKRRRENADKIGGIRNEGEQDERRREKRKGKK